VKDEVVQLLRDPRLTYCEGGLLGSVMMGQIVTMLSSCCELKYCPLGIPYDAEQGVATAMPRFQQCEITTFALWEAERVDVNDARLNDSTE
jgi:hypothetical protein